MLQFQNNFKQFTGSGKNIGRNLLWGNVDIKEERPPYPSRGKILVVDDMKMHGETVKPYLERSGYSVIHAIDTKTALSLMAGEKPDLVLLDVVLPGEDGLNLLSRLRELYPDTWVIIMTAYGSEDIASLALKHGAVDYIKKPFKYSNLTDIVEKALARQRQLKSEQRAVQTLQHAYEELHVSAESILQCLSSGVVAVDNCLRIRIINEKAEELLGRKNEEVFGKNFYDAFPGFKDLNLLKNTLGNERGCRHDDVELPGTGRFLNINTAVIRDYHTRIIGAVAVFEDVTELRLKDQMMKERERLVIIGQMAAGMAHELKNPLTSIRGFAQILSGKNLDPEIREYLKIMVSEASRMNQVIQDFLQLARPKQPEFKKVVINEILGEIISIIEPQAFLKNVLVRVKNDQAIPCALMDPSQIKQVLLNLVQNAIEAMENGGALDIETILIPEKKEICLKVSDTGCGIPRDELAQLNIPFYTTKADGTGLGLSISASIVDLHHGRMEVQSREGKGTTFYVFLPVKI